MKRNETIFFKAFEDIISLCKIEKDLMSNVNFIALIGSVRENEGVEKYSDLDILFILKCDESGAIDKTTLNSLKRLSGDVSEKYKIRISLLTHTLFDFYNYINFKYLIRYSWGKVVYGNQQKYRKLFEHIINQNQLNEKEKKESIFQDIIHARFNLLRRYVSFNKHNTKQYKRTLLKLFIDNVLEICYWCLLYKGVWSKTKKELIKNFNKHYGSIEPQNIPHLAYQLRSDWVRLKWNAKIEDFFEEAIDFIQACIKAINPNKK